MAVYAAAILVIGGTAFALNQTGALPAFAEYIGGTFAHLGGVQLSAKADRSTLPADGSAQTKITVITNRATSHADAVIESGSGQIDRYPQNPDTEFVYTAGNEAGPVSITVTADNITDTVVLTLVPGTKPKAPSIVAPPDGSTTNDPRLEVAGTGPADSQIVISTNGVQNTTVRTDDQGTFKVTLEHPLGNGPQTILATVVSELGVASATSNLVTITVAADPAKIDANNIRTAPSRIIAGQSFGVFIPTSLNTSRVVVELQDQTFELQNPHGTSVFSSNLPSPAQAGVYFANIVLYDAGNNATRFDKLLRLDVTSP